MLAPERRTRGDIVAAAAIVVVVLIAAVAVWFASASRGTTSTTADTIAPSPAVATAVPTAVRESWRRGGVDETGPVTAGGSVALAVGNSVLGLDPSTGEQRWSYSRDTQLCSIIGGWNTVLAVYRDARGCGQVTDLNGATGVREHQRSSDADNPVTLSFGGTYVTSYGDTRLEVWRSDLVRTLEYGRVDAPVNPGSQPRSGCTISSAATTSSRMAVLEQCAGEEGPRLTAMNPAPKDNTEPDVYGSTVLSDVPTGDSGARILAVSGSSIATYLPGTSTSSPRVGVFDGSGNFVAAQTLPPQAVPSESMVDRSAPVVDVGDAATWWTGTSTVGLDQSTFDVRWTLPGTLGAGAPMAGRLLVPVPNGIAVVDPATGSVVRSIAVDRGDYSGPVSVSVTGNTLVEKRGSDVVALSATG